MICRCHWLVQLSWWGRILAGHRSIAVLSFSLTSVDSDLSEDNERKLLHEGIYLFLRQNYSSLGSEGMLEELRGKWCFGLLSSQFEDPSLWAALPISPSLWGWIWVLQPSCFQAAWRGQAQLCWSPVSLEFNLSLGTCDSGWFKRVKTSCFKTKHYLFIHPEVHSVQRKRQKQ